jgi:hypothetical protein
MIRNIYAVCLFTLVLGKPIQSLRLLVHALTMSPTSVSILLNLYGSGAAMS